MPSALAARLGDLERAAAPALLQAEAVRAAGSAEARAAAEHAAGLRAALLDRVGLLLREPAGLDRGVELGVLRLAERVAQLGGLHAQPLGGVGEHSLLALLGFVGPRGGDRHACAGGSERAGRDNRGDACTSSHASHHRERA